ncbi:DUF3524 domain-containing protein [Phaeodactylibacter luteus]|uniref:tRNA-queuosine alpha-mannosyltransferase n=2 Tax=Phaeodactylibacter luteus TaxID=1564516 RepID=A0A5C6RI25_9BACT|nr:DUF3524 domain-containing protein [Phaeodactylibacter luteus]
MKIFVFEPFFSGSHAQWAKGLQAHSRHDVRLFTLPGRHWKWRMFGAAPELARQLRATGEQPDLVLASDMLDLAGFLGHLHGYLRPDCPVALYFHENQLTYPWSPTDTDVGHKRDRHYAYLNYTSALAADHIFFNSAYHQSSFLGALPAFLKAFPDTRGLDQVALIAQKSTVLPLGLDLKRLGQPPPPKEGAATLLWNHRWEYDKNPEGFFELARQLDRMGLDFQLIVLGQAYPKSPAAFAEARTSLSHRIRHWGYADSISAYAKLLWQADLLPVTGFQDFFGGSVVEAMYCNCHPILPNRLAYPEHLPPGKEAWLYDSPEALLSKTVDAIHHLPRLRRDASCQDFVARYDWSILAERYDAAFEACSTS